MGPHAHTGRGMQGAGAQCIRQGGKSSKGAGRLPPRCWLADVRRTCTSSATVALYCTACRCWWAPSWASLWATWWRSSLWRGASTGPPRCRQRTDQPSRPAACVRQATQAAAPGGRRRPAGPPARVLWAGGRHQLAPAALPLRFFYSYMASRLAIIIYGCTGHQSSVVPFEPDR